MYDISNQLWEQIGQKNALSSRSMNGAQFNAPESDAVIQIGAAHHRPPKYHQICHHRVKLLLYLCPSLP